jgi:Zn-dependent protease
VSPGDQLVNAVVWYVVLVFSLTLHEAAHAWAARRGGDPTAYLGGQVSLDPRPHMRREPFGMVVMPLLSFSLWGWMIGWASTPFDPGWALAHPRRAGWMSLAGPAANLALVLAAGVAIRVGLAAGLLAPPETIGFTRLAVAPGGGAAATLALLLSILFTLNLLLGVFNLIPVPPLDGSGVLGLFLPAELARRAQLLLRRPQLSFAGLIVAWLLLGSLFGPVHLLAIQLLYPEYGYGTG